VSLFREDDEYPLLYERVFAFVRKTLREDWDPIGVGDLPACHDEYDSYAAGIAAMLMHEVSDEALGNRFREILAGMGLATPDHLNRARQIQNELRSGAVAAVVEARGDTSLG